MAHTYTKCLMHYVFSTKNRERSISADALPRLHAFLGGIAREHEIKPVAVGGVGDHAHLLLSLPPTVSVAKAAQLVKGGSSKFMNETVGPRRRFEWQEGYGAFSIGVSQTADTVAYIANQAEHHRVKSFEEEYRAFLVKNQIIFEERYLLG